VNSKIEITGVQTLLLGQLDNNLKERNGEGRKGGNEKREAKKKEEMRYRMQSKRERTRNKWATRKRTKYMS
jgi:hypothetical protein